MKKTNLKLNDSVTYGGWIMFVTKAPYMKSGKWVVDIKDGEVMKIAVPLSKVDRFEMTDDENDLHRIRQECMEHPLYSVFMAAIEQAMYGKGERHGGGKTPFFDQPWVHYQRMHGRGFLTGQSSKKLEEAAHQREGKPFIDEVLGAIVYAGMAVLREQGDVK